MHNLTPRAALVAILATPNPRRKLEFISRVPTLREKIQMLQGQKPKTVRKGMNYDTRRQHLIDSHGWQYKIGYVKGDGNCLYGAISIGLTGTDGCATHIRLAQVEQLLANKDKLCADVKGMSAIGTLATTYDKLLEETTKVGEWGTESNIFLASGVINRPIDIVTFFPDGRLETVSRYNRYPNMERKRPLQLILFGQYGTRHFELLLPESQKVPEIRYRVRFFANIDENLRIKCDKNGDPVHQIVAGAYDLEYLQDNVTSSETEPSQLQGAKPLSKIDDDEKEAAATVGVSENGIVELNQKMDTMLKILSNTNFGPAKVETKPASPSTDNLVGLQNARSVADIMEACPYLKLSSLGTEDDGGFSSIVCDLCFDNDKVDKVGEFSYSSSRETDFHKAENLPKPFCNLKKSLFRHMRGKTHLENLEAHQAMEKQKQEIQAKNIQSGLICGRYAYKALKMDANASRYK